jgi:hypothetical protein
MKSLVSPKPLVVILLGLAVLVCTTWVVNRSSAATGLRGGSAGTLDERIEQLTLAQEAQARQLERLESLLANRGSPVSARGELEASRLRQESNERSERPLTAAQAQQKIQDLIGQENSKFASEYVSSSWASPTEKLIDSAISTKTLAWNQAPAPLSQDATCHSTSCRIQVTYADDTQADIGQQFFLGDIASRLPRAKLFRLRNPDGTVQVIAYANSGSGRH